MQLPKRTPLQSRLLTSVFSTCLLIVICLSFRPNNGVYAAELPIAAEDLAHSQVGQSIPIGAPDGISIGMDGEERGEEGDGGYVGDFAYFDRSLIGRAPEGVDQLTDDKMMTMEITPGTTRNFVLERRSPGKREEGTRSESRSPENASTSGTEEDEEALEKRQSGSQVFISVNTCRQPIPTTQIVTSDAPQLALYISTSAQNQKPGPDAKDKDPVTLVGGFANFSVRTDQDVFIGVSAPKLTDGWNGSWSFEVAASTAGYYHTYNDTDTFLYEIDADSESALFITHYLVENENNTAEIDKWMDSKVPFTMYAFPEKAWGATGLERSACGLRDSANSTSNLTVAVNMTLQYGGDKAKPKGLFHVQGLENNTMYHGYLVMNSSLAGDGVSLPENSTVGAGGRVWKQFKWKTKATDSCQVIYGLSFCNQTAYAVPSSSKFKFDSAGLAKLYDDQAAAYYQNFSNSLDQVACDTTGTAQYSLARNCNHCREDYKSWLCSVLMPRCDDFDAPGHNLQERNIGAPFPNGTFAYADNATAAINDTKRDRFAFKQSRNPMIDELIRPGPYKELLPCETLCFDIVRSCPATLQFSCPNQPARSLTYGAKEPGSQELTCNAPGAVVNLNTLSSRAGRVGVGRIGAMAASVAAMAAVAVSY